MGRDMTRGTRNRTRTLTLRGLVFGALAAGIAGTALAPVAASAAEYPGPPVSPTVQPNNQTNNPTDIQGNTQANPTVSGSSGSSTEVLGARVTRGSMPFTGGDIVALTAIGVGAVGVGVVLVRRSRARRAADSTLG
jgi:hypothetical protein